MTDDANGKLLDKPSKKINGDIDEENLENNNNNNTNAKESFAIRLLRTWEKLKFKSTLGHLGLLLSLAIYCAVGGYVSVLFCSSKN
jgi:hypothetical protein